MMDNYFTKNAPQKVPKDTPVLILANKIDLCPKAPTEKQIEKILKPKSFDINYKIGLVSALKNEGIEDNFKWLVKAFLFV
jgi:predicted GTPase